MCQSNEGSDSLPEQVTSLAAQYLLVPGASSRMIKISKIAFSFHNQTKII